MARILAYFLSILFLVGFFWFDCRTQLYDAAIPYFAAVLFALWSPKRLDVVVVSILCLLTTMAGGYFSIESDQSLPGSIGTVLVERGLSIFALVCVAYVGWQRRGISIRLQQMNELLEQRVDISEKGATEIQEQLSQISLALDQHTVERRQKERGFRETIASYQTLLESLPINVFQKDRKAKLILGNARYFETLGKPKEECIGKTDFDLFPRELAEKYYKDDQAVIQTGEPIELIEEHVRPSGQKIYVQVFKAPIRNARNKIIGLQGMFWDVTDRIQAEQSQKEADARFRSLVDSNIIGIFTGTFDGKIVDANDEFLNMVGYCRSEMNEDQLHWRQLTPDEFAQTDQLMEKEVLRTGFCRPVEKEYFHKDGRRIPVLVGAVRLDSEKDEAICSVVDITRQKEAERALEIARDVADEANRAKTLFLANMSHEIRTPLNAIIGMTVLVLQGKVSREQGEYLKMVQDSGEALLEIINDILDFSKLQAGKLKLEPTEFSLKTKLAELLRPLSIRVHEKGLRIVCDIAEDVPDQIYGDPVCLRQVVTNLVSNAIKFTEQGEIVVAVSVGDQEGSRLKLQFAVSDTGPGIEKNLQRKIFREFEQADNTSTRKFGGTGLGLAICLNLVKLMGGEIWVESDPGQGSTFHFTSDWEDRSPAEPSRRIPSLFKSVRLLLVDPHNKSLAITSRVLRNWGFQVDTHVELDPALDLAIGEPGEFQVLLLDEESCGASNLAKLTEIRELQPGLKTIFLKTSLEEKKLSPVSPGIEAQFQLLKPVHEPELFEALTQVLSETEPTVASFEKTEPDLPALKVLLAEDNIVNQRLVAAIFSKRGHEIKVANDGGEAIRLAGVHDFDLILMDIQMPNVDGIQATKAIRKMEQEKIRKTLIIALTAHAGEIDRTRCLDAGMDGYLTKPLRHHELMVELKGLINKSESGNGETGTVLPVPGQQPYVYPRTGVVDWQEALKQTDNDPGLLDELIRIFMKESPVVLEAIDLAIQQGDRELMGVKTHHLKGSFRVFACQDAMEVAIQLETLGHDENAVPVFEKLKTEYNRVMQSLNQALVKNGGKGS